MIPKDSLILQIALPTPLRRIFDYLAPQGIEGKRLVPGLRVRVPFQSRKLVGVVIGTSQKATIAYHKLKRAETILDDEPILPPDVYKLCQWASDYYHCALGEVLSCALPALLRQGKAVKASNPDPPLSRRTTPVSSTKFESPIPILNHGQLAAFEAIAKVNQRFQVFLLDGVTGSGKTEVYLQCIANRLERNEQVLVLVPEISLTPQTVARFKARFDVPTELHHSSLTNKERLAAWQQAKSGEAKIVIGTRSAIFTPFANLGLIIVDEEHDSSFKQQDRFRYHARDLAVMRALNNRICAVKGWVMRFAR